MDKKVLQIFDNNFADLLREVIDNIILHDKQFKALKLMRNLERAVHKNLNKLKNYPELLTFYQDSIIQLKFICLPRLENKEITSLIKYNFNSQFQIQDYSLLDKLKIKLKFIIVVSSRNVFKEELKQSLLENKEQITHRSEIREIKDWLKNYVAAVGLELPDQLAKAQYFINLKDANNLGSSEYSKLKILFNIFDYLNTPADSPQGFDEEPPVYVNGKLYIFNKGSLELVPDSKKVNETMELINQNNNQEKSVSDINDLLEVAQTISPADSSAKDSLSSFSNQLTDLQQDLQNYSPTSLEYKALSQEISRLKRGSLRITQQESHVKK